MAMEMSEIIKELVKYDGQVNADGCKGCKWTSKEEWELPCSDCKRAMKDRWESEGYIKDITVHMEYPETLGFQWTDLRNSIEEKNNGKD